MHHVRNRTLPAIIGACSLPEVLEARNLGGQRAQKGRNPLHVAGRLYEHAACNMAKHGNGALLA